MCGFAPAITPALAAHFLPLVLSQRQLATLLFTALQAATAACCAASSGGSVGGRLTRAGRLQRSDNCSVPLGFSQLQSGFSVSVNEKWDERQSNWNDIWKPLYKAVEKHRKLNKMNITHIELGEDSKAQTKNVADRSKKLY
jgi:hypothetical protein